ncbi:DoxX family protein [Rhodanobacter sp. Root179]|uniref:hypothetical protein n=1 Tax=Rhodanobacter sp. Root561 TaxID=1736560 RepID=UPI000700F3CA|nr:hypothetical protein [Rhodanobacter sp. Root561]
MHTSSVIFKLLGTVHGLAGVVLLVFALGKDFQKFCFYNGQDAFTGSLRKNLALLGSLLLIACGLLAFFKPTFAIFAAGLSFLVYLLPSLTHLMAGRPFGKFCKECAMSFGVRALAFMALASAGLHG